MNRLRSKYKDFQSRMVRARLHVPGSQHLRAWQQRVHVRSGRGVLARVQRAWRFELPARVQARREQRRAEAGEDASPDEDDAEGPARAALHTLRSAWMPHAPLGSS